MTAVDSPHITCLQYNYFMVAYYMVFSHVTWLSLKKGKGL